jgi:MFS transporter, DHA2 family, methylenomycin A resistance protein
MASRTVLVVMCVGYFLVLLDVTIVNVALPKIGSGLDAGVSGLQWTVDGYALALASLMLACGTLGDLHGHRRVVLGGLVVFGVGSLGCGIAGSVPALVGSRAVQGVGAALLLPGTLAIISDAFPTGAERAKAIGIWAGVGSLALPAGPLIGGALVDSIGWRAIFLVNVPIVAVALSAATAVLREHTRDTERRLDVRGVLLSVGLLLATTFAFIEAGDSGVDSPAALSAAFAAVILLGLFVAAERARGDDAMLPLPLFQRPAFSVSNGIAGTMNLCTLGALFPLTLFLQTVQGRSPLAAGVALVPLFAPLAVIAPAGGRLTARIGPRVPIAAGLAIAAAGLALLVRADAGSSYDEFLPAFLLWGVGLGILTPAVVAASIAAAPRERSGLAAGVNNTFRQAGGALGIAVAGAVAGEPGSGSFVHGFHVVALAACALYVAAAALGVALIPTGELRR